MHHRHRRKTAEERFHTLARGWLAYPVTPMHALLPPKSGCRNVTLRLHSLVAERRHSSVTRYAKRSVACRDSPRQQPLRAGGTPLPHHRRLPHPSSAIHRIAPSAQYIAIGVTPSARSDSGGRMGHRLAPSICAPAPTAQAVTPSVNPRPRRGYTHRRICAAERRR